jgi:predicted dehydrogenase
MEKEVLLVGSGGMAIEYVKVLLELNIRFTIVGRGEQSAKKCREATGCQVITGELVNYLSKTTPVPSFAIVAVGVEKLHEVTLQLLEHGVKKILVEKPGSLTKEEISDISRAAKEKSANVQVGYNRRFYAATLMALDLIKQDGGVESMHFEFTEWGHQIGDKVHENRVKNSWFLANSTHVVDLAFYLGGTPVEISSYTSGTLSWHPTSSAFSGAGRTNSGAIFSYQANWSAPGRWGIEITTSNYRIIFRPLESLQIMRNGSVKIEPVELDDRLDKEFKPGLYEQVRRFCANENEAFCDINEQLTIWDTYCKIAGYKCETKIRESAIY